MASRLLVGIMSCEKYAAKRRVVAKTWLRDLREAGIDAYFLVGRSGQHATIEGDVLYLDCGDTYATLSEKTLAFIRFMASSDRFDYLFKCDDDTYVNVERLLAMPYDDSDFTTGNLTPVDFAGYRNWLRTKGENWDVKYEAFLSPIAAFPVGGEGYFLSRRAADRVVEWADRNSADVFQGPSEDILVTRILEENGIVPRVMPDLSVETSVVNAMWLIPARLPFATVHPVSPWKMKVIHARTGLPERVLHVVTKVAIYFKSLLLVLRQSMRSR